MKGVYGIFLFVFLGCNASISDKNKKAQNKFHSWQSLLVTATAYNSVEGQTKGNPKITAWGDTLKPGMKSIAVSRDLIKKGLQPGTKVKIEGLDGFFVVNDKMHRRWKDKIDIYMGTNKKRAVNWGKRTVEICFD